MILETLDNIEIAFDNYLTNREYSLVINSLRGLLHYPIIKYDNYEHIRMSKEDIRSVIDENLPDHYIIITHDHLCFKITGITSEQLREHLDSNFFTLDKNIAFAFICKLLESEYKMYRELVF